MQYQNEKSQNKLYWFYLVGFFIILFLPLLNLPPWFSPPAWGQTISFRIILSILLFLFICQILFHYDKKSTIVGILSSRKNKVFWPFWILVALLGVYFLSTLFSLDISHSLWGTPERAGGFVNSAFYIIFAILVFLIIKERGWKKLLDFSLIIGVLAALIGIFQQFGILSQIFVSMTQRPSATMGNPIIFSLFLLPLLFLALSFLFLEKNKFKKILYFFAFLLFLLTIILITQSRAGFLGILIGLFWFLIAFPASEQTQRGINPEKMKILKIGAVSFIASISLLLFFLGNNPQSYEKWHPFLKEPVSRIVTLTKGLEADEIRLSALKISVKAFWEKPILGYGPENFSIAFEKHYDPLLPAMERKLSFDRSHNSLIEILLASGIFGLIFYLVFFFSLLWQLQKIKKDWLVSHGLQSAFLSFMAASLFSIEGFSSYLVFFLLIGYSLELITRSPNSMSIEKPALCKNRAIARFLHGHRYWFISVLLLGLLWFNWQYNIKPFQINTKINIARELAKEKNWSASLQALEQASERKSFLLPYANIIYSEMLIGIISIMPEEKIVLSEKISQLMEKNTEIQPNNKTNWYYLGQSLAILAEEKQNLELAKKAQESFKRALRLSPNDPLILLSGFLADVVIKDFEKAKEKSDYCLKNYPEFKECLWVSGLINIYFNDIEKGSDFIEKAREKKYPADDENSLSQLIKAFAENKNYREMVLIYEKLIKTNPLEIRYKTSLAFVYRELGEYKKARELALEILKINPELEYEVNAFLKTLNTD
ncbi:MAG: hypothetical protein FJZ07_02235 [Candidatus Nealsonbacteria bacterium]|nr:hypothetical protein [Candidatus Nealsonbacteria bacterium]